MFNSVLEDELNKTTHAIKFIATLLLLTFAFGALAQDWYIDYRNGNKYFCALDSGPTGRCISDDDCGADYTCAQNKCVVAKETCIRRCSSRDAVGGCLSWGQDFCGIKPECRARCKSRDALGRCLTWTEDFCGRKA